MSNKIAILIFIIFSIAALHSQNKIIIPDTLSGSVINLSISNGEKEFLKGKKGIFSMKEVLGLGQKSNYNRL